MEEVQLTPDNREERHEMNTKTNTPELSLEAVWCHRDLLSIRQVLAYEMPFMQGCNVL